MKKTELHIPASYDNSIKIVCLPNKNKLHKVTIYCDDKTVVIPNVNFTDIGVDWGCRGYVETPEFHLIGNVISEDDKYKTFIYMVPHKEKTFTRKKKMTIAEIERELGYSIEVVGDE